MAAVACTSVKLYDNFPGVAKAEEKPVDGFTGSYHHNQAYERYRAGEKICVYDDISKGWATFVYLKLVDQLATSYVLAAGNLVGVYTTTPLYYEVSNDQSGVYMNQGAVALSAMTTTYWGWFWCGGVCPQSHVTALATATIPTDGNIAAGSSAILGDSGANNVLGLLPCGANTVLTPVAESYAADA